MLSSDLPVPRIFAILLIAVLGSPTAAWGGSLLPEGIEYLGSVPCCGSDEDPEEPSTTATAERPCCCSSPSPQAPSVDNLYSLLSDDEAYHAPVAAVVVVRTFVAQWPAQGFTDVRARAPPPASGPLLAQHTALLI